MKNLNRLLLMPLMVLMVLFGSGSVWGQSAGFNNTFIVLSLNGGANTYYDLNATTASTDFNGANLGSFAAGTNNLVFKGAEHNIYKCGGADLTSTRVYYRIYLTSAGASGSFTSNNITYTSGFNNGCGGQDQKWDKLDYSTNLLSGLAPGNYSIQVYSDASTTLGDRFASNGGLNYTASFTVSGNYYSKSTGNLELTSSWVTNTDGTGNAPANFTTAGNTFNIRNNATPTIGANWTVSGAGSKIIVGDGTNACNFTVPSTFVVTSPASDVSNNGTITRTSSGVQSWGTLNVLAGGTYDHNYVTGSLPTATWAATSSLLISADLQSNNFAGVNFGNVTFRNAAGTTMFTSVSADQSATIAGNLNLQGTGAINMSNQAAFNSTLTVNGNVNISGNSTFRIENQGAASGTNTKKLLVLGNYDQSNGTMDLATNTSTTMTNRQCILEVRGNFTHTGGTLTENASGASTVMFTRVLLSKTTGTQTLESTGQTGSINFNVAGSNAQCVVSAGKTFVLGSGGMTVAAGTATPDLLADGTLRSASTISTTGTVNFSSTGTYEHNTGSGGLVPTALWNATSTCKIISSGATIPTQINQNFGNFEWANSTQTGNHQMSAAMTSIQGNFTISNTGTGTLRYNAISPANPSFSIGGNFIISGGTLDISSGTSTPTLNISGNFTQSGGTLTETGTGNGKISLVKSSGNQSLSQSAGTIANTINWNIGNGTTTNTVQLVSNVNLGSGTGTFTVLGNATFDAGTYVLSGSAASTINSGGTLITANSSGVNGSITLSGTRTYNAAANYAFNGSSAQVTGAAVTSANNLTLNNSAGLTLSAGTSVTGTLTLTNGKLTIGASDLTLGAAASVSGASSTKYIVTNSTGQLKKASLTTAFTFPVGNSAYNPISITNSGTSDTYGIIVTDGAVADATISGECVNRRWYITEGTSGGGNVTAAPQYNTGETGASYTTGSQVYLGLYVPTTWTKTAATVTGSNPFTASASGFNQSLTSNSFIAIGNEGIYIAAPTVTETVAASSITNTTASSGGQTLSGTNITSKGVVWNTSTAPTVALSTKTDDGTGSSDFTSSITSLSPETLYYIRAYVTNAAGTGYGDEKTFRTLSNPATAQATSLSATANSSSNIDLTWNAATFPSSGATNKGYVLLRATSSNTPSLGNSNGAAPTAGANTTIVSSVIAENATSISNSGLAGSTQYNYLLIPYTWDGTNATTYNYLTTSAPTANATTQSGSTPPVLTTNAESSVLSTTATFNGEITSDGGASVTARGFVYSTSDATPTIGEGGVTDQSSGSGTGTFNSNVSSLSANTTYYYQAYATNTSGTSYGGVISFTTLKAEPSTQATSLVFSSITTSSFNSAFTAASGSPDGYLVIRSTSASLSADPVDGTTYTAGNSLGGGTVVSVGSTISGISNSSQSAGTTYYTFVFAYNNSGSNIDYLITSPLSSSTITLTDAPATPTFSNITTNGLTVDWTATSGASTYRLDVSTVSNFASYVSGYQDLTVNTNSQAVTGLAANTLYYVRVRAVNASGTSANSTSTNSATLPNSPTVGTASSITATGLTANWTAPSSQGAVTFTYTIELSTANDFSTITSTVSSIALGTTTNAFSSLSEGTTYYYRIKAVNSAGSSAWSSVSVGATTLTTSISLTDLGTAVTQDFNSLVSSGTSSVLPSGWYLSESGSNANITYTAGTGSGNSGDSYSFGSSSDRALGGLRSGSLIPAYGAKFTNNTGATINNLFVSYKGETWRVGAANRIERIDFQYSLNATALSNGTWTDFNALDYSNPGQATGSGSVQHSSTISDVITTLSIANGASFMIRWTDYDPSGANDGMGIDDFSIKPCGTVSAPTASDQAFCSATSPTVASLTATGTALQWYSASTGGTALSTSTALTNSTTYYATQTVGGCESVSRAAVIATVNINPSVPTGSANQTLCTGSTVAELSATGTSIQWYSGSTGGSALATNTALVNSSTYYASQTTNSCESTTRFAATAAIVSSGSWIGGASTDWSDAANWCGGVPTSSTSVTIPSGTSNSAVISSNVSLNSLTINSGATISTSNAPTITIANNGSFTNNGTFTAGTSKVSFAGNGTVSGTVSFNNIDIAGGVNFGSASTINGTLSINSGGYINTNAPIYGIGSTLKYNSGGAQAYGRSLEWSATSGQGAPYSVQVSNSTTLNYPNTANSGANAFSTNLSLAGDLTLDNGSALYMDWGGNNNKSGRLDVAGNVLLNGNLSLGNASGGDIKVGGNWTRNSGSTFTPNARAVFFTGNGSSIITGNGGETFPYLVNDKSSGSIQLGSNVTLTSPSGGNALSHKSTAILDLNGFDITFSGPSTTTILANGASSLIGVGNMIITNNLKTLTQSSGSWSFGSSVVLRLENGLNFGNNVSTINGTLELNSGGFVSNFAPNYASGSILKYNSGTTYGRNVEWYSDFSSGTGVPANVLVSSGTTLNLGANNNAGFESTITGNLTLDGTLSLAASSQNAPLNVSGNVVFNGGGLTLSTSAGGDIKVGGNWSGTGTFTPNSRAVFFNGTGNQSISRNDNFPYLFINKASGILTFAGSITLNNKLTYSNGTMSFSGGSIDASGASAEVEFANSGAYTLPTGLFSGNVNKLTLNGSGGITLSENVTVSNSLKLTSGVITLGSRNLTLTGSLDATDNGGTTTYINTSGSGAFIRSISTTGVDYKFPVGLSSYAPISVNFTGGTVASSSLASRAVNGIHPNATDGAYIRTNLYWEMNQTGMTNPQYNISFTYPGTTNGVGSAETEDNLLPAKWSASTGWLSSGSCSICTSGSILGTSTINTASKTITWNGVTGFSDFGGFGQGNGSPLPVELLSFNGTCNEGMVDLLWQTASEFNSSHFDVEKSTDGETWRVMATVPSAGTSNELLTYQAMDNSGTNGSNYYRLRQVDIDGKEKLYDPINVSCVETTVGYFTSYPNPSGNDFQVIVNNKEILGACTLNIVDAQGKVIDQRKIEVKDGINMFVISETLNPGIYFLNITNGTKTTQVIKHAVK